MELFTSGSILVSMRYDIILSTNSDDIWYAFIQKGHPFLRVCSNPDIETVAKVMHKCWALDVPKIVTLVVSNKSHRTQWTNQRQIKNFLKGLIDVSVVRSVILRTINHRMTRKAAISTNMWILTNGVNTGVADLIGNSVESETYRRRIKRTLKRRNLTNLIGIVTEDDLRYGEIITDINKVCTEVM